MQHFSTPKIILCALLCGFFSLSAQAASTYLPVKTSVLDSMVKASNYFTARWSDASLQANFTSELSTHNNNSTSKARASNLWTRAVYLEGLMQLYNINKDASLKARAIGWGTAYNWMPYGGSVTTNNNADALCCGQVYIELSLLDNLPARRANIKSNIDLMVAAPKVSDLYWIDALQMAMPVFAKLGVTENNTAYFDKMYQLYQYPKTTLGLYNTTDHLWYRDAAYPDSLHNGLPIYWSRGNGWVVAALVRVLDVLPTSDSHRSEYVKDFQDMMAKLITIQRTDGFWNGSLVNPTFCGGPETSGTALFTYGLAWGIHNNLLDSATYYPPLAKAWEALQVNSLRHVATTHTGITASRLLAGSLNWVQGSGSNPAHGNCIYDYDRPDFDDYGLGALLLAGSEVYKLAPTALLLNVSSSTAAIAAAVNSTASVNVTSNVTWTATSNQSWLTVSPNVSTTGNATLTFTVTANTGAARSATVTVTGAGITQTITVTQSQATATWTGTGNWSAASNWSPASVPAAGVDVMVVSGSALTIDQTASVVNLTLNSGAQATLSSGKTLTVTGNLNLLSDATNGTATFVDNNSSGGISVTGTTNVQQYLTGAGSTTPNGRFWYVSSPVAAATSATFDAAGSNKLWSYSEPSHAYTEITANTASLAIGAGYSARLGANTTVVFTGTGNALNTGDKTVLLTRTGTTDLMRGYNLIGNPYISYLNWTSVTKTANVNSTVWFRSLKAGGSMVYDAYNATSGIVLNNSGNTVSQYIPPMQAFWVKVKGDGSTGQSLTFTNAMRSHQSQSLATGRLKAPAVEVQKVLRLQVSNSTNSDETVISFNPNASDGFDDYDSPKLSNNDTSVPELYTQAGSEQVAINGLTTYTIGEVLPLGFTAGEYNTYTIKATEITNFDAGTKIVLKDNLLQTENELSVGTAYSFTSDVASSSSRFSIIFKSAISTDISNASDCQPVAIYKNANRQIVVTCNGYESKESRIAVYGSIGQQLINVTVKEPTTIVGKNLLPGIYLVSVNIGGKTITKKVVID